MQKDMVDESTQVNKYVTIGYKYSEIHVSDPNNGRLKRKVDMYSHQYCSLEEKLMGLRKVIFDHKKYEKTMEVKVDEMEHKITSFSSIITQK